MRLLLPLLLMAAPANAGVRATYHIQGEAQPLIVDVADNGDASFMQVDGEVRVLVSGGHAYGVGEGDDGLVVARFVDVATAMKRTGAPAFDTDLTVKEKADLARNVTLDFAPVGPRTVHGIAGTAYRLTAGSGTSREELDLIVMTNAAALQPIGKAMEVILAEGGGMLALMDRIGPDLARWARTFSKVAALGTPVDLLGLVQLRSVETRRIPPETVALPAAPMNVEAVVKRIRQMTPGA